MTDPSSLTTVPDEVRGKRTFTGTLIFVCLLAVSALGFAMVRTFTRVRPAEEIAREHFNWDYRFKVTEATDDGKRSDAWLRATTPAMTPVNGVEMLYTINPMAGPPIPVAKPVKKGKSAPAKPLRYVGRHPSGEIVGVEYDTKRRLYHLWWQSAP